jgi:hypothetical protein
MTVGVRTTNADGTRARGGSNGNERGGSKARAARRAWLVKTFRADVDVYRATFHVEGSDEPVEYLIPVERSWPQLPTEPACRCYRCGELLTVDMVSADRIKPGCDGGTYARTNIRPACKRCNSVTGATTRKTTRTRRTTK